MPQSQDQGAGAHSVLLFLFAIFLLASPFTTWWMTLVAPWYFVYLLWLLIIGLTGAVAYRMRRHAT